MNATHDNNETLVVRELKPDDFAPFGDLIEAGDGSRYAVNDGTAMRFHDLARIDVNAQDGQPCLSIFRAQPRKLPLQLSLLERHPLSSQAFVPLGEARFLIIVAAAAERPENIRAFISNGQQGVNFSRGTWHHPLIALDTETDFLVMDRNGPGDNCDEFKLPRMLIIPALDEET